MSLYQLSKFLFDLNRVAEIKYDFAINPSEVADRYRLSAEERQAVLGHDIGLLYVLGVNGQILMHFAALIGIEWSDYLQLMRDGVKVHGPVRAGVYAMTTDPDERIAG